MKISTKQHDFLKTSTASWNIACGSVSSGKTFIQILRWLDFIYSDEVPHGSQLAMIGKTLSTLYNNVIRDMLKFDDTGDMHYTKNPHNIKINSKDVDIVCIGANNEGSVAIAQGITVAGMLIDEATNVPKSMMKMLQTRCRWAGELRKKFCTLNPASPHHYFKKEYIDNQDLDKKVWNFTFMDNPVLTEEYKQEIINSFSGAYYQRLVLGKWLQAEGVVYDKFQEDINVIDEFDYTLAQQYLLGIDWGYTEAHKLALVLVAKHNDSYYCIDELYLDHILVNNDLKVIMEKKGWFDLPKGSTSGGIPVTNPTGEQKTRPRFAFADSARPDLINQFFLATGIKCAGALKDVDEGIQAVQRLIMPHGDGKPRLFVLRDKCPNLINEFDSYVWAEGKDGVDKGVPAKDFDHLLDALRYLIYTEARNRLTQFKG